MTASPRMRKDVLQREVEDELLLYDPKSGETLLLNASAAVIADLCDGTRGAEQIADAIVAVLETADRTVVVDDVTKTVDELRAKGMLEAPDDPSGQ